MSGNSKNRPGIRKTNKKGAVKGSGGARRRGLRGKGPTPKAEDRVYHAAHKRKLERQRRDQGRHDRSASTELVVGRNPVIECLHARVPATALYIAQGTRNDDRLTEAVQLAHSRSIPLIEVPRIELDSMTGNGLHQGVGLQIPPFEYADVFDLIGTVADSKEQGMIVVLDNITDPRNLGAVIRSTAAFGGQGVVIPEGHEYHPHPQGVSAKRLPGCGSGCGWGHHLRFVRWYRPGRDRGRLGGQGAVPPGSGNLRRAGFGAHHVVGGVAECLRGCRGGVERVLPAAPRRRRETVGIVKAAMNKPLLATGVIFLSFGVPLVILWLVVHLYPGAGWIITWSHVWYLLVYPVLASAANSAGRLIPGRAGVVVQEVLEFVAWCMLCYYLMAPVGAALAAACSCWFYVKLMTPMVTKTLRPLNEAP